MSKPYIILLDLGDSVGDRNLSYLHRGVGEKEYGKRMAAYIGGAKKKIVVDTGPPDLERSLKYHPYSKSDPWNPEQEMEAQLAKAGVKAAEIDVVVLTHLHWDHVGDVLKFPNAQFICSQEELRFALDPITPFDRGCRHPDEARPAMEACGIDVFATARNMVSPSM
jgi:glyoxylase-like metal-dependent hydrolase (beta-lactamase superfamily II)